MPLRCTSDDDDESEGDTPSARVPKARRGPAPPALDLVTATTGKRSSRTVQPSAKQQENNQRLAAKKVDEVADLKKRLQREKQKRAQAVSQLHEHGVAHAPLESEEEDDRPISQFSSSFTTKAVVSAQASKTKTLRKTRGKDMPIAVPMPTRAPLQVLDNVSRTTEYDDGDDGDDDDTMLIDVPEHSSDAHTLFDGNHMDDDDDDVDDDNLNGDDSTPPPPRKRIREPSPERAEPPRPRKQRKTPAGTEVVPAAPLPKAQFVAGKAPSGSRTNLNHFRQEDRPFILAALHEMEAYIWTKNAFPSIAQQDTWVKEIWAAVQTRTEKRMELTDRIATMMKNYGWHARGAVVKEVRTLTDATYLLAKGTEEEIKKRVKVLTKDDTFHYRNPETLEGFAQNDIIKMALQNIWFPSKRARGVVHSSHFSPISIPTLALIFAAIEFSIQRYSTGELDSAASFDETHNKPRYEAHLKNLKEWDELLPAVTAQFRQRLYDDCRKQSGAAIVRPAMGLSEDRRARALRELQEMQQGA